MERQFTLDPVKDVDERARLIADKVEQVAHEMSRTVAAVEAIVDDVKVVYKAVVSLFEWLKTTQAGRPAKVQLVVSTD